MRAVDGAGPGDSDLRQPQIQRYPIHQWPIGDHPQPRQASRRRRLRRARLPSNRRQVLPQRRVDRLCRCLRLRQDLGDPQRLRLEEGVQGFVRSDRRSPVVARRDEDRRLR